MSFLNSTLLQVPLTFFVQVLLQTGLILQPNRNTRANQICNSGCPFCDGKYTSHFDNFSVSTRISSVLLLKSQVKFIRFWILCV